MCISIKSGISEVAAVFVDNNRQERKQQAGIIADGKLVRVIQKLVIYGVMAGR